MRRLIPVLAVTILTLALSVGPATMARAGGGAHCAPMFTDAKADVVRMTRNCFVPTIARVDPGAKVSFVNEDGIPHTVTGAVFVFGSIKEFSTGERSFRFEEEGTYPYVCILHPGMAGAIVVGDGKGAVSPMSVTEDAFANPPAKDNSSAADAEAPGAEPAAANGPGMWPIGLAMLAIAGAAAVWLPRRKTPQLEG